MKFSSSTVLSIAAAVATVLSISTNVVDANPLDSCACTGIVVTPDNNKCNTEVDCNGCDINDCAGSCNEGRNVCSLNDNTDPPKCTQPNDCSDVADPPDFPVICDATISEGDGQCVGFRGDDVTITEPAGPADSCPGDIELKMVCYKCGPELDCIVDDRVYADCTGDNSDCDFGRAAGTSIISLALREHIAELLTPGQSTASDTEGFCLVSGGKWVTIGTDGNGQPGCENAVIGFSSTTGCCIQKTEKNDDTCPVFGFPQSNNADCEADPNAGSCKEGSGLSNAARYTITFGCGGRDDPHFDTFGGEHYDFQGACDLVLVDNPSYKDGKGLYIHARTKLFGSFSSIVSSAIKIGDDILEVHGEDLALINGIEFPVPQVEGTEYQFPIKIGGYDLTVQVFGPHSRRHIIHMGDGEKVMINNFKEFVNVFLYKPQSAEFEGSAGMWGTFSEHGSMVARDGKTVINDGDAFGFEWQVNDSDPQLFHVVEGVQYPAQCEMPEKATATERHLRAMSKTVSEDDAKKACSKASVDQMESCIANVFGADNTELAQLYTHASL